MDKPLLSICIPTFNRCDFLVRTIDSIVYSKVFSESNDVEIVISNNCSNDNTHELCKKYAEKYPDKIKYIKQETPIFPDNHIFKTIEYANGKFCKLNNDTLAYSHDGLNKLVEILKNHENANCLFLFNIDKSIEKKEFFTFDDFIKKVSYNSTSIGSFCIKKEVFESLSNPLRYANLKLPQVDIYGRLFEKEFSVILCEYKFFNPIAVEKKGGDYNIAEVFGKNYFLILNSFVNKHNGIRKETIEKEKENIIDFINKYCFNAQEYNFKQDGYLKYMIKTYALNPYFYLLYFKNLSKYILHIEKTNTHRNIKLLNFLTIKIKRKSAKKYFNIPLNENNKIKLINASIAEKIIVGNGSYGEIDAIFSGDGIERLVIGDYCSIAPGVKFIVSSDHPYKGLSTYPFKVMYLNYKYEAISKGNIVLKDDVWIGANSTILSGVTIGQGAVVAAGSVVTKDVPPYAIVGGNPAKVIKYRFEPEVIEKLKNFDYSKLTEEKIKELGEKLYTEITKENVDELLKDFQTDV